MNSSRNNSLPIVACMTPRPASPKAPAKAMISPKSATRLGTGRPPYPTCVEAFDVANPIAPASMAPRTIDFISAISSAVAARSVAASPITHRRTGVWPIRTPTLMATPRVSMASRNSGNVWNGQLVPSPASSAATLMPSTFSRVRTIRFRCAGRVGATPKPQLPITAVVTPCHGEILNMRSHMTCAS